MMTMGYSSISIPPSAVPLVSVIMNCLNCSRYLVEAIDSVYAQTYTHWEIVLWDNASQEELGKLLSHYDERLRYFRSDSTTPLGAARNQAMQHAKGEFIAFLDCDDVWLPGKLEAQLEVFSHKQVGVVCFGLFVLV